ncbi:hypothetical protein BpHYR1_053474 [Brachionus plicatilis]|uniref:Uncharacterized protein n=1 Tax=Brachionus plicatilis TaxID=10195 RepID=A0A3M7P682_BRAPC|nr:hypothetical protein BpHYR1_053474 [Brachionus plicatilis]
MQFSSLKISFRSLPERLRPEIVPFSEYHFLVEETHFGDTPNSLNMRSWRIFELSSVKKIVIIVSSFGYPNSTFEPNFILGDFTKFYEKHVLIYKI